MALDTLVHATRQPAGEPEGVMVLVHGRGADEHDLLALFDILDPDRRLLGVCPRGPLSLPPGGAHWYVVRQVGRPDPETFFASYERLGGWLDAVAEETGVHAERTFIGGFSQGAAMTYALGLGSDRPRPAAMLCFSGFVPVVEGFELDLERAAGLPVAIGHGTYDPVIEVGFGHRARALLEGAGAEVVYRESPMPHSIDPLFLEELVPWVGRIVDGFANPRSEVEG